MGSKKQFSKGRVTPITIEDSENENVRSEFDNHTFVSDEMGDNMNVTASKDKFGAGKSFSGVIGSEKLSNPLEVMHEMRTNMGQWKSYACSRRVKKKRVLEDDEGREYLSGLGLDDRLSDKVDYSKPKVRLLKQDSHLAVANQALIQYFAKLGQSQKEDETVDLDFVHTLLKSGADINCTDRHGQTILHEVTRSWHVDVAKFLIDQGADVNKGDLYGRTPLHIAAAVDYVDMVNLLLDRGANKEALTLEENQTPVFYAARTDAVQSLKTLILKHGCRYKKIRDYKGRTPIHVAAELDRSETSRLLLQCEAPVYLSDNEGTRPITWMISKMAPVASQALGQLYSTDRANRKHYFALNYLVHDTEKDPLGRTQTPIHMAVGFKQYDLLMHPVFRSLMDKMWLKFGRFWTLYQLGINFIYIIMWTIIGILVEYDKRYMYTMPDDAWRIVLYILAAVFTLYQIAEEILEFRRSEKAHTQWENTRKANIQQDIKFCHPRWPEEKKYLLMEIAALERQKPKYFHDWWNIFDWICYILLLICIFTHVGDIAAHTETLARLHIRFMTVTIILLWLRLMKNVRAFPVLGPFIVMLGHMIKEFLRFLFLYMEFYIPYLAAFWMTYGGTKKVQDNPSEEITVGGFEYPGQIFFSLFRLTLVDDYDYDNMVRIDSVMADILLSSWFLLSSIMCLNLLIALLSDTFQRVYDNSQANAVMQRAITVVNVWEGINKKRRDNFMQYIETFCSPLKEEYDDDLTLPDDEDLKKVTIQIKEELDDFKEMFRVQFGDPKSKLSPNDYVGTVGDVNPYQSIQGDYSALQKFETELNSYRESLQSLKTQVENTTVVLHKDMKSIKQMLRQLVDKRATDVSKITADKLQGTSSKKTQKSSDEEKKKKRPLVTGLDIDYEQSMSSTADDVSKITADKLQGTSSKKTQKSSDEEKKKKLLLVTGLDIDYEQSMSSTADAQRSPAVWSTMFQNITKPAESQIFDVPLPLPLPGNKFSEKKGADDGDSNC